MITTPLQILELWFAYVVNPKRLLNQVLPTSRSYHWEVTGAWRLWSIQCLNPSKESNFDRTIGRNFLGGLVKELGQQWYISLGVLSLCPLGSLWGLACHSLLSRCSCKTPPSLNLLERPPEWTTWGWESMQKARGFLINPACWGRPAHGERMTPQPM